MTELVFQRETVSLQGPGGQQLSGRGRHPDRGYRLDHRPRMVRRRYLRLRRGCDQGTRSILSPPSIRDVTLFIPREHCDKILFPQLSTPLSLGRNVKIVPLATPSTSISTGSLAIVTGWGKTSVRAALSNAVCRFAFRSGTIFGRAY